MDIPIIGAPKKENIPLPATAIMDDGQGNQFSAPIVAVAGFSPTALEVLAEVIARRVLDKLGGADPVAKA